MSFSIVDNLGNVITNKKTGKPLTNLSDASRAALETKFKDKIASGEIRFVDDSRQESEDISDKSASQQRIDFATKKVGPMGANFAGIFPNTTQDMMDGKGGNSVISAGQDLATLVPRVFTAATNLQGLNWENIGRRGTEGEDTWYGKIAAGMSRDPLTYTPLAMNKAYVPFVNKAAETTYQLGKPVVEGVRGLIGKGIEKSGETLGNAARNLTGSETAGKIGQAAGSALGGAAIGMGTEYVDAGVNNREAEPILGALMGGGFEVGAQAIAAIARKVGTDGLRWLASAFKVGNTGRRATDEEILEIAKDPKALDAFMRFVDDNTKAGKMLPFVGGDRGKSLDPMISEARRDATSALDGDRMLQIRYRAKPGEDLVEADKKRVNSLLTNEGEDAEKYRDVVLSREQKVDKNKDFEYGEDVSQGEVKPSMTNDEFHIGKMVEKYSKVDQAIKDLPVDPKLENMTAEEQHFLEKLRENEVAKDINTLGGMNPAHAMSTNYFLGNYNPFDSDQLRAAIASFREGVAGKKVSQAFKDAIAQETAGMVSSGKNVMSVLEEDLKNIRPQIDKALQYGKNDEYYVMKGYASPLRRFADELNAYINHSQGTAGENSAGQMYTRTKDKFAKYAYSYLYKIQDMLHSQQSLDADFITELYGEAANANDRHVQELIIQLLNDLGVNKDKIAQFEKVGSTYAMLRKARSSMGKGPSNINVLGGVKGAVLQKVAPQKGVNFLTSQSWKGQGHNLNLGDLNNHGHNTAPYGNTQRYGVYFLGRPAIESMTSEEE